MNIEEITEEMVVELITKSRTNSRNRAIMTLDNDTYSGPQTSINIIQEQSYIQPHCRFSDEKLIHYSGILCSIQFEDDGSVKKSRIINHKSPYLFIPANTYQTLVALELNSAIWMIVQGPHDPKNYSRFLANTPSLNDNFEEYFENLKNIAHRADQKR